MSYYIEVSRCVVRIPKEISQTYEDAYLFLSLGGDNNLISTETNRFSRSWNIVAIGEINDCMSAVTRQSIACETGSIKSLRGDMLPEAYIKKYRTEATKNPISLEMFRSVFTCGLKVFFNADKVINNKALTEYLNRMSLNHDLITQPQFLDSNQNEWVLSLSIHDNKGVLELFERHNAIRNIWFEYSMEDNHHRRLNRLTTLKQETIAHAM